MYRFKLTHAPLSQQIFNIPMAKIESVVEPDCILNDFGWKSVMLVCF